MPATQSDAVKDNTIISDTTESIITSHTMKPVQRQNPKLALGHEWEWREEIRRGQEEACL